MHKITFAALTLAAALAATAPAFAFVATVPPSIQVLPTLPDADEKQTDKKEVSPETDGAWRVLMQSYRSVSVRGHSWADSFPVEGTLKDCKRIATRIGKSYREDPSESFSVHCLNTRTGDVVAVVD